MKLTGAQAILQSLIQEGVDLIFGYPGGAIMPTYDALHDMHSELRHILVRHEQGAVHAAEGYARATGRPGVCLVTSGPGATNLLTGIADAMLDSVPLVCITGQVASHLLGTDAFQEVDIISMSAVVTKWNCQITSAADIPAAIAKAFYMAQEGRPGPVLLDITKDAQIAELEYEYKANSMLDLVKSNNDCLQKKYQQASDLINQAKKPFLLVGHGVLIAKAEQELLQLAEKATIPVACTLLGLSAFPADHPLYMGMLGMHGNYGPNLLTNQADVIIAVGMRFDDRVTGNLATYAKQAKIIHIEIDPTEIDKNVPANVSLLVDAKIGLQQLLTLVNGDRNQQQHASWVDEFNACHAIENEKIIVEEISHDGLGIKMAEVVHELSQKTAGQAVIVSDVGQHQMYVARYYQFNRNSIHITSGGLGTMGFALPAAIGAKLANMDNTVLAIIGDGGFQMTLQELGVIAQEKLPIKIVILNNSRLGMVRQWQELFFDEKYSFTHLESPDFLKVADAYGIVANRVSDGAKLSEALDEMLNYDGPYLLEVVVKVKENIFPMIAPGSGVGEIRLS